MRFCVSLFFRIDCISSFYLGTECVCGLKLKLLRFVDELESFKVSKALLKSSIPLLMWDSSLSPVALVLIMSWKDVFLPLILVPCAYVFFSLCLLFTIFSIAIAFVKERYSCPSALPIVPLLHFLNDWKVEFSSSMNELNSCIWVCYDRFSQVHANPTGNMEKNMNTN